MEIIVFIPILFLSIILHECAHGWMAYRLGDDTAYLSGRLTLNPIAHVDIVGTLIVPAFCYITGMPLFGWAKPVPVNPFRLPYPRRDMGKVALAGPAMNFSLAILFVLILKIILLVNPTLSTGASQQAFVFLRYGILVNIMLALFNLIPILPLDGGRILVALLPVKAALSYELFIGRYGQWIVIAFILLGWVKYLIIPPAMLIMTLIAKFLM